MGKSNITELILVEAASFSVTAAKKIEEAGGRILGNTIIFEP